MQCGVIQDYKYHYFSLRQELRGQVSVMTQPNRTPTQYKTPQFQFQLNCVLNQVIANTQSNQVEVSVSKQASMKGSLYGHPCSSVRLRTKTVISMHQS